MGMTQSFPYKSFSWRQQNDPIGGESSIGEIPSFHPKILSKNFIFASVECAFVGTCGTTYEKALHTLWFCLTNNYDRKTT